MVMHMQYNSILIEIRCCRQLGQLNSLRMACKACSLRLQAFELYVFLGILASMAAKSVH